MLGWQRDFLVLSFCHGKYVDSVPHSATASANNTSQDHLGLTLSSDKTEVLDDENLAVLDGHVEVNHGKYYANAEHADIFRDPQSKYMQRLSLSEHVHFWLPGITVFCDKASVDLRSLNANLESVIFRMDSSSVSGVLPGRGSAKKIKKQGKDLVKMRDATYTTCPPIREAWHLRGARLDLDKDEGWGSITHARLYVHKLPIFYFPYFMFPLDERRHTGMLLPSFAYSNKHHTDISLPVYLNLGPNYDATITPRFIQERGWESNLRARYLTQHHSGQFEYGLLEHDRMFAKFKTATAATYTDNDTNKPYLNQLARASSSRYRLLFTDEAHWGRFWKANIAYHHVSDPYYYRDLGLGNELTTQDQLLNQMEATYAQGEWEGVIRLQDHQALHQINQKPSFDMYRQLPYLSLTKTMPYFHGAKWSWNAEWVNFDRKGDFTTKAPVVKAKRSHLSSTFAVPFKSAFAYVTPAWLAQGTWYDLEDQSAGVPETPHRVFNTLWLDSGMRFDRKLSVHGHDFVQTLEPRFYYVYTPYKQQDDIPTFDTVWQVSSYDQLFTWQRFIGHDRVSDENRIALGAETRFLDSKTGSERLRLALGTGYAFDKRRTCLATGCTDDKTANDRFSPIAGVMNYNLDEQRNLHSSLVWLPGGNHVDRSEFGFHFARGNEKQFDINYTHLRPSAANGDGKHIVNTGLILPVTTKWQVLLGWDYDISINHAEKSMVGLKYESCCWTVRVLTGRQLVQESLDASRHYDNLVYVQFLLKGLGSVGGGSGTSFIQSFNPSYEDTMGKSILGMASH